VAEVVVATEIKGRAEAVQLDLAEAAAAATEMVAQHRPILEAEVVVAYTVDKHQAVEVPTALWWYNTLALRHLLVEQSPITTG
jgi:hypothetical protein